MNLNFIGQEFDRLHKLEDYINYEYEPKSNKRVGKRNIFFEDIKLDFINEVNTYGFSPFILKNFSDQRDDPNIMRFMTKKFNHGLTNYVKLETKAIAHHTSKDIKKYIFRKKQKRQIKKSKSKKKEIYTNIFLVRKNEDKKIDEAKENFLQKALLEVGGNKLNISMEEEEEQANKEKENEEKIKKIENTKNSNQDDIDLIKKNELSKNQKEFILKEKELLEREQDEKNIELLKKYMGINRGKYAIGKNELQQLPNLFNSNDSKKSTLKLVFQNKGYNSKTTNFDDINTNKKILSLSKNKELLGDKREYIFKRLFSSSGKKSGKKLNFNKGNNPNDIKGSFRNENRSSYLKKINGKKQLKDEFLLFAKARPYRYMTTVEN